MRGGRKEALPLKIGREVHLIPKPDLYNLLHLLFEMDILLYKTPLSVRYLLLTSYFLFLQIISPSSKILVHFLY